MSLLRFLGLDNDPAEKKTDGRGETDTVRRIASPVERLDAETAKYLAALPFVLAPGATKIGRLHALQRW